MPRTILGSGARAKTPGMKALEDELIRRFGLCIPMKSMLTVLGMKDRGQVMAWTEETGIQTVKINGRNRWLATDVARALEESKIRA